MSNNRIEYIDLAKGFCIILVVFNHIHKTYDAPYLLADCFKMFRIPLYFFLSGLFFKNYEGIYGFIIRKINKLLIPFSFFYLFTSFLLPNLFSIIGGGQFDLSLLWSFINPEFFPNFPIWFLICLFQLNVIFYVVYLISEKFNNYGIFVMTLLSGILGFLGYYLGHNKINLLMFVDTSLSALPFFYIGFISRKYTNILQPNRIDRYNLLIACCLFFITFFFAKHIDYSTNNFINASFLRVYGCGISGVFSIIFLSKTIKFIPYVSYLGKYSIMILCTHFIIITYLNVVLKKYISYDWIAIMINLVLTLSLYSFIIPFMKKYMPYVTAQKDVFIVP